jgi:two-component system, chemotaxis family, CheB/CheR fusion protein
LLTNAIKFTPAEGHVTVALTYLDAQAKITISDTGRGIGADFLPHVFDRWSQADAYETRSKPGLGLGLSIVQSLVELHGGTVGVASPGEGQGATFTVWLPRANLDEAASVTEFDVAH